MAKNETMRAFSDIVDRLRADTGASRTTIRVDCTPLGLEMETVAAESRDDGVRALEGKRTPDLRSGAAPRWLRENRRTFVMEDCLNPWAPEVAPEDYVIELYGIRAEMVAGVFRDDDMVGIVSVHYTKGPRTWTDTEVERIEAACDSVREVLEGVDEALASGG